MTNLKFEIKISWWRKPTPSSTKQNFAKPFPNSAIATMGKNAGSLTANTNSSDCPSTKDSKRFGVMDFGGRVFVIMGYDASSDREGGKIGEKIRC